MLGFLNFNSAVSFAEIVDIESFSEHDKGCESGTRVYVVFLSTDKLHKSANVPRQLFSFVQTGRAIVLETAMTETANNACTKLLLREKIIISEQLDTNIARKCKCLLIQCKLRNDDDVDILLDLSLELSFAINDMAKTNDVVSFLGIILQVDDAEKKKIVDEYVSILKNSTFPGIPTTFLFFAGCPKNTMFNCTGNGRRWWYHSYTSKSISKKEHQNLLTFIRTLEHNFERCPANTTSAVVKLLTSVALPTFFGDEEYQCLLHRTFSREVDDLLLLFFICAQISTVRVLRSKLGYDIEGNRTPMLCIRIDVEISYDLCKIMKVLQPTSKNITDVDLKHFVDKVDLTSLSTVSIHSLVLKSSQFKCFCWNKWLYILPLETAALTSYDLLQRAFFEGFLSWRSQNKKPCV